MKTPNWEAISGIVYGLVAIFTFGHAAEGIQESLQKSYQQCLESKRVFCTDSVNFEATLGGLASAAIWPFYWSWEIQDND